MTKLEAAAPDAVETAGETTWIVRETLPCYVTWSHRVAAATMDEAIETFRDGGADGTVGEPEIGDNIDGVPYENLEVHPDTGDVASGRIVVARLSTRHGDETRALVNPALAEAWRQSVARERWSELMTEDPPADSTELADVYFETAAERHGDSFSVEILPIESSLGVAASVAPSHDDAGASMSL